MKNRLPTASTFALAPAIEFLQTFPPCQGELALAPGWIRGAFALDGRAVPFTVTSGDGDSLTVDAPDARVLPMVGDFLGVADDLGRFYERARVDVPAYRAIVRSLRGLHHVRFRTLEEVTVHAVLGQRTSIVQASRNKRRVAEAFGPRVDVDGRTFVAFPAFDRLLDVTSAEWLDVVRDPTKARRLPWVIDGVASLGADWLRGAPHAEATRALQAIDGIGPFSAAMILLRGLGRMDDVPLDLPGISRVAQAVYGPGWDPARVRALYGTELGNWAFYLKAGAGRSVRRAA